LLDELRALMWNDVGPLRGGAGLERALMRLGDLHAALASATIAPGRACNASLADWFELRASLIAAEAAARAPPAPRESRGAHQRMDFPDSCGKFATTQSVAMSVSGALAASFVP